MTQKLFITGTDTNVGKTYISKHLLEAYNQQGLATLGLKPIASGCILQNHELISEDAVILQQTSSIQLPLTAINPFTFTPPISPHLAAAQAGIDLNVAAITQTLMPLWQQPADIFIIEGCGGWYVPLNDKETMADLVKVNNFEVILVVGMRLGCLNHALLTYKAIQNDGLKLAGWIANCIDPEMLNLAENIATLTQSIAAPCLAIYPRATDTSITGRVGAL